MFNFAMNAFQMLHQSTSVYAQHKPGALWDRVGPNDKILGELTEEDEKRFAEIHQHTCDIHRLSKTLNAKLERMSALQTLFWQDVRDKYEDVRLKSPPSVGIRKTKDGKAVIVSGPDLEEG